MIIHRSNFSGNGPAPSAGKPFAAVAAFSGGASAPPPPPSPPVGGSGPGDVIYGARAIAQYLFGENDNRARRRVFNLWAHYRDRGEHAGFCKLKGALCLSKSKWRNFHGL